MLSGARLTIHAITGNGTPAWSFSSFGSGNSGVAAAKGADRSGFMESNAAGDDFRQHGFRSTSNGTPDWSFPYPVSDPNLPASSRKVATSRDGSTIAAVVSDSVTQNQTLYIFDANTGTVTRTWTDPLRMDGVALTDNGSLALVTQDNRATLIDTSTANIVFSVAGSGAGNIFYPISGDGSVFAVGGFDFDVYKFNGTTYVQVIHLTRANFWFGGACTVSHDGSTAGTCNWLRTMFQAPPCSGPIPLAAPSLTRERRLVPLRTTTARSWLSLRGAHSFMTGQRSWCLTAACS